MTLRWRDMLDWAAQAGADGLPIKAQVLSRAIGVMLGHELTLNTFYTCPTLRGDGRPAASTRRCAQLRDGRTCALASWPRRPIPILQSFLAGSRGEFDHMFLLGDPPDYEQPFEQSIAARARRLGRYAGGTRLRSACSSAAVATIFT